MQQRAFFYCLFLAGFKKEMTTYFIYNNVLLFVFLFGYLAEHLDRRIHQLICRFIVFLALFLPAAFRYETGTDYGSYVRIFNHLNNHQNLEIGWLLINKTVRFLNLSVQWIFIISAILIYYPICFITKRKNYFITVVLYVVLLFYFKSFNALRQMIAVSFLFWTFVRLKDKSYFTALILVCIAYCFHTSALFIVPLLLFCAFKINKSLYAVAIFLFGMSFLMKFNFLELALTIASALGLKYAKYAKSSFYTSKMPLGSGLGVMARLLFVLPPVFLCTKSCKNYGKTAITNLALFYIFTYICAAQFVILGRVRDLFIFIPLLIAGNSMKLTGRYKKIVLLAFLSINILLFEMDIKKQTRDTFSNSIYPYYSIFYEGQIK